MIPRITNQLAASFEHDIAQRTEVSDRDIHFSRLSGMSPVDIDVLCDFTRTETLLVVIRCPKRPARYFHGEFDAKPAPVKAKSNPATGLATADGKTYVSDYDLMCVWRFGGQGHYEKILFRSRDDNDPLAFDPEAKALMALLEDRLRSPFQHGAQDDFNSNDNPNIAMKSQEGKPIDRFMVFNVGTPKYVCTGMELKKVYDRLLGPDKWPYNDDGVYAGHYLGHA